jgi:glycerophosphoryl diester phosphodiesterase
MLCVAALGCTVLGHVAAAEPRAFLKNGVTAHRGNSGEFPENTMPAFESALALGVDWIELDIYLSKDRQVVVCHDKDTARVGDKNLLIAESTYAELLTVDVAAGFRRTRKLTLAQCPPHRVPLLEDVLKLAMRQNRTRLSLQPKDECVQAAFEVIRRLTAEKWVGFNDGSLNKMRQVKTQNRKVPVFWDRGAQSDIAKDILTAKEEGFESLVMNEKGLTREKVDAIRRAGFEVGVWTVNDEAEWKRFLAMGVQRIYTDYPARLLSLQKENFDREASRVTAPRKSREDNV